MALPESQQPGDHGRSDIAIGASMDNPTRSIAKKCSLCGQPIAPARLEALPGATTCIACAKKYPPQVDTRRIELSEASPINRNGFAPKD
jgi:hypothetical protein